MKTMTIGIVPILILCSSPMLPAQTTVGADRLLSEFSHLIDGKRLALVSNHSGRLADGTHLADTLNRLPNARLTVLFGMEFNIRTNDYSLPRDGEVALDPETGLKKYSLYGGTHKPTAEMLGDVDAIIFDIQEVGARFYEHINILGFVMEAAAENSCDVIVLDRPNPITGVHPDGFVTDDEFLFRFGSYAKVPVLHGMTIGELALMYNGEGMLRGGGKAVLHVIPMLRWKRSLWYDEAGLPWRKPSPNLLTLTSVLAYAGTCLFEGLNVSEGRGTDTPFEVVGAPWIDHAAMSALLNDLALPGVIFEPVLFTPEKKPHLSRLPELSNSLCRGVRLKVFDRDRFQAYRTGVAMVWAVHRLHADKLVWDEEVIERLTGTGRLVRMIREGRLPSEIFASWENELELFKHVRQKYLLYEE
jgi:uncharacterized protein YbbC (DUF1343 family)